MVNKNCKNLVKSVRFFQAKRANHDWLTLNFIQQKVLLLGLFWRLS